MQRLAVLTLQLGFVVSCVSDHAPAGPASVSVDCAIPADAVRRGDRLVFIRDFVFLPDTVRITAGETVTWVNCEPAQMDPHTSTADNGSWGSPLLRRGEVFSHTFADRGSFGYFCLPHNGMRGAVIVR